MRRHVIMRSCRPVDFVGDGAFHVRGLHSATMNLDSKAAEVAAAVGIHYFKDAKRRVYYLEFPDGCRVLVSHQCLREHTVSAIRRAVIEEHEIARAHTGIGLG